MQNSPQLRSSFTTGAIHCPAGNYAPNTNATNGTCTHISYAALYNNIFWQNRSFQIGVGSLGTGTENQQSVVKLYNAAFNGGLGAAPASQTTIGQCVSNTSYWDLGVRNDKGPANHSSGYTLNPLFGVLTSTSGYSGTNVSSNPLFATQYCNGARVPPEAGGLGYQVPVGVTDSVVPTPVFALTPNATVDEGNNWVNMSWGPLSLLDPVRSNGTTNVVLGNYTLQAGSPDVDHLACAAGSNPNTGCRQTIGVSGVATITAPLTDFFGNHRPDPSNPNHIDIGAVEYQGTGAAAAPPTLTTISPTSGGRGTTINVTLTGTNLTGTSAINVPSGVGIAVSNLTVISATSVTATFTISATATIGAQGITVTSPAGNSNPVNFTVTAGTLSYTSATNGTLSTFLGIRTLTFTIPTSRTAVTSVVTITNTGTAPLLITSETISLNTAHFSITGTSCSSTVPLPINGTCTLSVRYATPATRPLLPNIGTLTSASNGTSNGVLALSGQ
jgi:hypothetical protein